MPRANPELSRFENWPEESDIDRTVCAPNSSLENCDEEGNQDEIKN